ncbi:hypothetical protein BL253_07855 [Pseudofrankia asymbiotica]|uniref:Uncharacterized protein n=1 Tax=Pseudofrankia asymbiotica TaxID=1834516 RepID=A0A1V2IGM6_9ACTN|nr:hypothetical protein BL253_07855 [Pseudofrankia asymbiotica]
MGTVRDIGFALQGFGGIRAAVPTDEDQPHAGADAMSVVRQGARRTDGRHEPVREGLGFRVASGVIECQAGRVHVGRAGPDLTDRDPLTSCVHVHKEDQRQIPIPPTTAVAVPAAR